MQANMVPVTDADLVEICRWGHFMPDGNSARTRAKMEAFAKDRGINVTQSIRERKVVKDASS